MDLGLRDAVAYVTGASTGIGAATAVLLAEEGADVVVGYGRDRAGAEATAAAVRERGRRAWLAGFDLADPDAVPRGVERIRAGVGGLDVAVLCAGENRVTGFADISADEWRRVLDVNLSGTFYVLQAVAPLLRDGGAIVTVASVAAATGAPHHPHYAAAKAGVVNLTKSAARWLAPRLRVNCVAPGITETAMGRETIAALPDDYAGTRLLAGRFAAPHEIAACIVFLASPRAGFVHGATLDVNGGRDLR
ncbi:MAG TPA: SDR family NAD(P)-dependent oxidoreductase [Egibacteraceae bacterium]